MNLNYQHSAVVSTCLSLRNSYTCTSTSSRLFQSFPLQSFPTLQQQTHFNYTPRIKVSASSIQELLPLALDSTSQSPSLFDGTTRLYISYTCPYAQRVWIARNCKGLQDTIQLVPINLKDRPIWYKEKVYPQNKVPALEHNNEVMGESLDLLRYINFNFEGPSLFPEDPYKMASAEVLLNYVDSFRKAVLASFKEDEMSEAGEAFDYIETSFESGDGPFFIGEFSLVDIAYAPFIERFQPYLLDVKNYDITIQRPKLARWIEEMNKIEGYTQTKRDPEEHVRMYKRRFQVQP